MARPKKDKSDFLKKAIEDADENDILGQPIIVSESNSDKSAHIVISPFRDKDDFSKKYSIDDDVSHFDKERLQYCIEKGLVEKQ